MSTESKHGGSIGFIGLLAIVLIAFKLAHIIEWSWIWVLAPLWGGFLLGMLLLVVVFIIWVAVQIFGKK